MTDFKKQDAKKWFKSLSENEQLQVMETTNSHATRMNWVDICFTYPDEIARFVKKSAAYAKLGVKSKKKKSALSELVFALNDVLNYLEWERSGSPAEKAYDRARKVVKKYSKFTI